MSVPRYFVPGPLEQGVRGELSGDQARHFNRVLRRGSGDKLVLFDGSGVEATATAAEVGSRAVTYDVRAISRPDREPPMRLTVGLGLTKAGAFELAVQKLTEIGVARVVPLETRRSVATYRDARDWERRAARLERIVVEAAEQSERVTLPEVTAPSPLAEFIATTSPVVLVERGETVPLASVDLRPELAIAVGPEGGWAPEEFKLIKSGAEATMASLGRLIYRAETAAIVAAGTLIQRAIADAG